MGEVEALENTTRKQTKPKQCPAYIRAMIASVLILHYKVEEHFSSCFNARNVIAFNPYSMQDMEHKSYEHCVFCQVLPTGSFDWDNVLPVFRPWAARTAPYPSISWFSALFTACTKIAMLTETAWLTWSSSTSSRSRKVTSDFQVKPVLSFCSGLLCGLVGLFQMSVHQNAWNTCLVYQAGGRH